MPNKAIPTTAPADTMPATPAGTRLPMNMDAIRICQLYRIVKRYLWFIPFLGDVFKYYWALNQNFFGDEWRTVWKFTEWTCEFTFGEWVEFKLNKGRFTQDLCWFLRGGGLGVGEPVPAIPAKSLSPGKTCPVNSVLNCYSAIPQSFRQTTRFHRNAKSSRTAKKPCLKKPSSWLASIWAKRQSISTSAAVLFTASSKNSDCRFNYSRNDGHNRKCPRQSLCQP